MEATRRAAGTVSRTAVRATSRLVVVAIIAVALKMIHRSPSSCSERRRRTEICAVQWTIRVALGANHRCHLSDILSDAEACNVWTGADLCDLSCLESESRIIDALAKDLLAQGFGEN